MGLTFDMEWHRRCTREHQDRIARWANEVVEQPCTIAVTLTDESGRRGHLEVVDIDADWIDRDTIPTFTLYDQTWSEPFPV